MSADRHVKAPVHLAFVCCTDVARFNDMFLEREEDAVIRLRSLEDDAVASATAADLKDVYRWGVLYCFLLLSALLTTAQVNAYAAT